MAPKKNTEHTAKKTPKKRVVKSKPEKPKLKTPSVIKVKIPSERLGPNGITPKLTKKQLTVQKKLELANEVALAQLARVTSMAEETPPQVVQEPKVANTGKGKRKSTLQGRDGAKQAKRKKNSPGSISEIAPESSSEEVFEQPKRKVSRKPIAKKIDIVIKEEKTETLDSITLKRGKPKLFRKKKDPESSISEISDTNIDNVTVKVDETATKGDDATTKVVITDKPVETNNTEIVKTYSKLGTTSTRVVKPGPKVFKNNLPITFTTRSLRNKVNPNKITPNIPKNAVLTTKGVEADDRAGAGETRKTSSNSSTSGVSWTQDVSTSSTTTCVTVTSNDFVRFDKKLPVVEITNMRPEPEETSSDSEGESSASSPSSPSEMEGARRELDLSVSSPSAPAAPQVALPLESGDVELQSSASEPRGSRHDMDKISAALERLTGSLCDFDAEMVEWIGRGERARAAAPSALYDALKLESEAIAHCRILKRILGDDVEFARPAPPRLRREEPRPAPAFVSGALLEDRSCDDFTSDRVRYTPFDGSADDDDALSLFAESITAIDSSRLARPDEYVPAARAPLEPRRYRPTRIDARARRGVCEKHCADSTSVRDAAADPGDRDASAPERPAEEREVLRAASVPPERPAGREDDAAPPRRDTPEPSLLHARPVAPKRSTIFRGLCFYNLATHCRFDACRFAHADLDGDEVSRRVAPLDDSAFLREYALVATSPALRRLALACARECARRGLTRALLEGVAQLQGGGAPHAQGGGAPHAQAGGAPHAQAALEVALQHLNLAEPPEELLELRAGPGALCDALLRGLADTQNFSRFRAAFVRLAAHRARRRAAPAPRAVVAALLERLCIVPCDAALARAMLRLLAVTEPAVYRDRIVPPFEVQLSKVGGGVYEEFAAQKQRAGARPRRASPDSTHYDATKKISIEPMITRTVDFKRALTNTTLVKFDPRVPPPRPRCEWRAAAAPAAAPNSFNRPVMRPLRRTVNRRPNDYQRRAGGDFYD